MISQSEIRTKLFGVVGLRQPYSPDYDILEAALIASSSGMFFDQFSAYVTVENIRETQPYAAISDADFNLWLTDKIKDSISRGIQQCFTEDDLIDNALLYDRSTRKDTSYELDNDGDFVGYEIEVSKRKDVKAFINKIIAEFSGTGDVKVLLFNDNFVTTLQDETITIASKSATEAVTNWGLAYANSVAGGKFYVGYLTSGLTPKAINREWSDASVSNCYSALAIRSIKVTGWNAETLFDIGDIEYVSETWGLNFDISSFMDYTSLIVNNKNMFVDVIGYQFAADILGMMITSTNINGVERLQKGNLLLELQGNFTNEELPTMKGVETKLKEAIETVKKQLVNAPKMQKFTVK